MDFWVLHNGPPHVALWIIKRQTNLNSKLSTLWKLQKENSKEVVERGRGNALRRTAWFVVVLFSNALERKFILVRCWNLRPFAAQPAHHPHGRRPLERAYRAAARWALGTTTRDKQWSLASDGPQVPSSTPCRMGTHTLNKAGKHLVVASMPRLLYITA